MMVVKGLDRCLFLKKKGKIKTARKYTVSRASIALPNSVMARWSGKPIMIRIKSRDRLSDGALAGGAEIGGRAGAVGGTGKNSAGINISDSVGGRVTVVGVGRVIDGVTGIEGGTGVTTGTEGEGVKAPLGPERKIK